jgi:hypothetical protein
MNAERPPDLMTPEERLAELATLLTRGFLRMNRKQREKALALPPGEPLLSPADGEDAARGKEQR